MPRRSIWKGSFVVFRKGERRKRSALLRMKKKRDLLLNRKIGSRTLVYFAVDCSVRIYNGKTFVRCKITEGSSYNFGDYKRLVINFESLLLHGNEDFREQILDREEKGGKSKV